MFLWFLIHWASAFSHFYEGRNRQKPDTVFFLNGGRARLLLRLQPAAFSRALACVSRAALADPVKESRALLAWLCGQGFSTLAPEQDGHFQLIDIGPCLGKPAAFAAWQRKSWGRIDTPFSAPAQVCEDAGCGDAAAQA